MRRTSPNPERRIPFARSSIARVTSVSAGPPCGGLYLNPPSPGGLWDGVITIPSANPPFLPRLCARTAWEITGVGVHPEEERTRGSLPRAALADRLRHGEDVGLVEGEGEGRTAVAGRSEG